MLDLLVVSRHTVQSARIRGLCHLRKDVVSTPTSFSSFAKKQNAMFRVAGSGAQDSGRIRCYQSQPLSCLCWEGNILHLIRLFCHLVMPYASSLQVTFRQLYFLDRVKTQKVMFGCEWGMEKLN
ncbi:hypothetical protein Droror1_Dr00011708 [Drosera rotundifolia]